MTIDQKRIAQILGVTQSSVSRALSDSPRVSQTLKERVKSLCEDLGYVPNFSASSLSSKKTKTISVLINPIGELEVSDMHSRWVSHLHRAAQNRGYKLRLDHISSLERIVLERSADGFIVFGFSGVPGSPITPESSPVPIIFTDCAAYMQKGTVASANSEGIAKAVEYLVQLGHHMISFYGYMPKPIEHNICLERYLGYTSTLNNHGIAVPSSLTIVQDAWPMEVEETFVNYEKLRQTLEQGATAIIASSDIAAIGVIRMLMRMGKKVPEDVSVIGFDDSLLARAWEPPLTTIKQDTLKASVLAVDMLISAIEEGVMPPSVVVPCPLIIRGTTGPNRNI